MKSGRTRPGSAAGSCASGRRVQIEPLRPDRAPPLLQRRRGATSARTMATVVLTAGLLLGKVPEARNRAPAMFAGIAVAVTGIALAAAVALASSALAIAALPASRRSCAGDG